MQAVMVKAERLEIHAYKKMALAGHLAIKPTTHFNTSGITVTLTQALY
jgi:hypothetical protein